MKKNALLFFVLSFLMITNSAFSQQDTIILNKVIAIVGNNPIYYSDIEDQFQHYQSRGMALTANAKCDIFEDLLIQKLMLNQAQIDSVEVTDKQVDSELNHRLDLIVQQAGGKEKIEEFYKKSFLEIKQDFREMIKDQMLMQKMQGKITGDIKITPSEVHKFFSTIPKDSLPIIDAEYEIAQICVYPKIKPEEKRAVRKKLEEMREKILKDGSFVAMAGLYSEDPASRIKGGELGFQPRSNYVPEFSSAAFALVKPGDISPVIETEFGFHIIQLIERRGEQINVRHILLTPKVSYEAKSIAKNKVDSVVNLIRNKKIKFEEAAFLYSEDEATKKSGGVTVNPQTGSTRYEAGQIDPSTSYVIKTMNVGEISNPFEAIDSKNKTIIKAVLIKSKTKPHTANMKDDFQKIHEMALANKKSQMINKWIKEKQATSYIHIDPYFKSCKYKFSGWFTSEKK